MKLSGSDDDDVVTYALGSCIGVAIYDPLSRVGGILHYMLPLSSAEPTKAKANSYMFGDSGIPNFFMEAYRMGAVKQRLKVAIAGGAGTRQDTDMFQIGLRNIQIARALFTKNNIGITAEHVGGNIPRTMYMTIKTGHVWIESQGQIIELL